MIRTPIQICCYFNDFCVTFYFIFLPSVVRTLIQICSYFIDFYIYCLPATRPADQYNSSHLSSAFHLDCALMLQVSRTFAIPIFEKTASWDYVSFHPFRDNEVDSVADPDPGSSVFYPWTRDPYPGLGMKNNTDPGAEIRKNHLGSYFQELSYNFFRLWIIKFSNSSVLRLLVRDGKSGSGIKIPDPHHWKKVYIFWVWSGPHLIVYNKSTQLSKY